MNTHYDGRNILNQMKMSVRCKICNASKIENTKTNSDVNWECQTCGNIVDANGNIVSLD